MLYDPEWEAKTTEPSLEGFIAWLETKDPNESYTWENPANCACGQYGASLGNWLEVWGFKVSTTIDAIAYSYCDLHTFGACLARAKQALAERPYA